jgi:RNA polymerase sigma factor (sigma-70 family)
MESKLIQKAVKGDKDAFTSLVILYQRRIFGFVRLKISNLSSAEEIVQETFLQCFINIHKLRDIEQFSFWLFRICRNCINLYYRQEMNNKPTTFEETDHLTNDSNLLKEWDHYEDLVQAAIKKLSREKEEVLNLRYFSGHSYNEIAVLCGISIELVKSRLFEAKKNLKTLIPNIYQGFIIPEKKLLSYREYILEKTDLIEKGAYVIRALSLEDQMHLCELIVNGRKFDSRLLEEFAKIKHGKEFVRGYESRLTIFDLSKIITYERYLDFWLISNLDQRNPKISEVLKRNTFVFEDIVLLDPIDVTKLIKKIDAETLFKAIVACETIVKKYVLSFFSKEQQENLLLKFKEIDTSRKELDAAQFDVVETLREMEGKKEITIQRTADFKRVMESNLKKQNVR